MWSVIVRISLNNDTGSKILAKYKPILTKTGFAQFNGNTGSWRLDRATIQDATNTLHELLQIVSDPLNMVTSVDPDAVLDHLWIYIERTT